MFLSSTQWEGRAHQKLVVAAGVALMLAGAGATIAQTEPLDSSQLRGRANLNQTPEGLSGRWSLERLLAMLHNETLCRTFNLMSSCIP